MSSFQHVYGVHNMSDGRAEDYRVTGSYLRAWLSGLRRISGQHYPFLLEKCNLSQFAHRYPEANFRVVATGRQIMELSRVVHDFLGPEAYNLFIINLGREFGRTTATLPSLKAQVNALGPIKDDQKLSQLFEIVIGHNREVVHEHIAFTPSPVSGVLSLIYHNCIYCAALPPMSRPSCPGIAAFWTQLIFEFTSRRFRIEEVRCGGMHDEHDCQFLIYGW